MSSKVFGVGPVVVGGRSLGGQFGQSVDRVIKVVQREARVGREVIAKCESKRQSAVSFHPRTVQYAHMTPRVFDVGQARNLVTVGSVDASRVVCRNGVACHCQPRATVEILVFYRHGLRGNIGETTRLERGIRADSFMDL